MFMEKMKCSSSTWQGGLCKKLVGPGCELNRLTEENHCFFYAWFTAGHYLVAKAGGNGHILCELRTACVKVLVVCLMVLTLYYPLPHLNNPPI